MRLAAMRVFFMICKAPKHCERIVFK